MAVRQGLPLGGKQTRSAEKRTFRALVRQDSKLMHNPFFRSLETYCL